MHIQMYVCLGGRNSQLDSMHLFDIDARGSHPPFQKKKTGVGGKSAHFILIILTSKC
jgi:hypothetical protein